MGPQGRGPICYMFMLSQMWDGATNCGPFGQGDGRVRVTNATINYSKHLQQISGLCGRREWPHSLRHGCAAVSQIQHLALMLSADSAHMGLDEARSTKPSSNPLGDMLGREWCHQGGKRSRYDANVPSSRACKTCFVDWLVQDACGNVAIRIGRLLASPQGMYINRIRRRW